MTHAVLTDKKGPLFWIELNRPDARNAIAPATASEVTAAFQAAAHDPEVRAIVLTGRGSAFCAGGDLKAMAQSLGHGKPDPGSVRAMVRDFHHMILTIYECEKPVIAAVNGPAAGAGCNLALVCDMRVASDQATFSEAFVHRGLTSDGGSTFLLPRLVGDAKAFELLMLGETIDAREALRIGLVNEVVPHAELTTATEAVAARLAQGPPNALAMMKRGLRLGATASFTDTLENEANAQALAMQGPEHAEGVQAFLEKRSPRF